jgi:type I restriction enzyme, R subunit
VSYSEANYENAVIEVFRDTLDYTYTYGPDVTRDYTNPLYMEDLLPSLQKINPKLPEAALSEAIHKLRNFDSGTILQNNVQFIDFLQNGVSINYYDRNEQRSALVYLVDYINVSLPPTPQLYDRDSIPVHIQCISYYE